MLNENFLNETPIMHMDFEVTPNYWCVVFRHNGKRLVMSSDDVDYVKLEKIVDRYILCGYNLYGYDLKILEVIIKRYEAPMVYNVSSGIINNTYKTFNIKNYKYIDLYQDINGSLKEHECNLGMSVVESSVSFDVQNPTESQKQELIDYCDYDVLANIIVFNERLDNYLKPKLLLAKQFGIEPISALKSTNASLACKILGAVKLNTQRDVPYKAPEEIEDYLNAYASEQYNYFKSFKRSDMEKLNFNAFENKGSLGGGGIHSTYVKERIHLNKPNGKELILMDVESYYPNLMLNFNYLSKAVKSDNLYREIVELKEQTNDLELKQALKNFINIVSGASDNKWLSLYDAQTTYDMRVTGQLLLFALANEMYYMGATIIQTNTDGVCLVVSGDSSKYSLFTDKLKSWEEMTGLSMKVEQLNTIIQKDVNNYIMLFSNGKKKTIGAEFNQCLDNPKFSPLGHNLDERIVAKAVVDYMTKGTPIPKTIRECKDLLHFSTTTKCGYTYDSVIHVVGNSQIKVNKVNRVIATNSTKYGTLYKIKKICYAEQDLPKSWISQLKSKNNRITSENGLYTQNKVDKVAGLSANCMIINENINDYSFNDMKKHIDYDYYIDKAKKKVENYLKYN